MGNKEVAAEIYKKHLPLAETDGRKFRKTVMDEIMATTGCSLAASATYYNNCKKEVPVEGLGRPPVSKNLRKPSATKDDDDDADDIPESDCFTVLELLKNNTEFSIGRCASFGHQGDASEVFDSKIMLWPKSNWVMITGMGPNPGDTFKLKAGEQEIKRHTPVDV